jgi:hypothetical protein
MILTSNLSAQANSPDYSVGVLSQRLTPSVETPTTLKEAVEGNLKVKLYSDGDWENSALEVKLAPSTQEEVEPVRNQGTIALQISYLNGFTDLPLLLMPSVPYSAELAPQIAASLHAAFEQLSLPTGGKLRFNLKINGNESAPASVVQLSNILLDL